MGATMHGGFYVGFSPRERFQAFEETVLDGFSLFIEPPFAERFRGHIVEIDYDLDERRLKLEAKTMNEVR